MSSTDAGKFFYLKKIKTEIERCVQNRSNVSISYYHVALASGCDANINIIGTFADKNIMDNPHGQLVNCQNIGI